MDRRHYLGLISGSLGIGLAGCQTADSDVDDAVNETADPENESDPEIVVIDYEVPDTVTVGEPVALSVTLENQSDKEGTYRGRIVATPNGPRLHEFTIDVDLPANDTVEWQSDPITFEHGGRITYYLSSGFKDETLLVEPESRAPRLNAVNLVTEWDEFGDTFANAVDAVTAGEMIEIADRHDYWHEDGVYHLFRQVRIFAADDERVAIDQHTEERTVEVEGFDTWEGAVWFDTAGWDPGMYTAEVQLRNEVTGELSEPVSTTFELESSSEER